MASCGSFPNILLPFDVLGAHYCWWQSPRRTQSYLASAHGCLFTAPDAPAFLHASGGRITNTPRAALSGRYCSDSQGQKRKDGSGQNATTYFEDARMNCSSARPFWTSTILAGFDSKCSIASTPYVPARRRSTLDATLLPRPRTAPSPCRPLRRSMPDARGRPRVSRAHTRSVQTSNSNWKQQRSLRRAG
ncbi:hypothetical protein B0H16DRAFT_1885314, partial [Mycena metata]